MPQAVGPVAHGQAVAVSIAAASPQAFAYRLWTRHGASEWKLLGEGSTATSGSHAFDIPFEEALQLYYWVGAGGHPSAPYECLLTFAQHGAPVEHGRVSLTGQLDSAGVAAVQDWVNFL